jgi:predicted Fe-Mo cluster-binding NifX family protein
MVNSIRKKISNPQKVAVATDSGEIIDACFGRVKEFKIYKSTPDGYQLEEVRPGPSPCREQSHDMDILLKTASLLSDCQLVLAGRIGPAAIQALSDIGVTGLAVNLSVEEALKKLARP